MIGLHLPFSVINFYMFAQFPSILFIPPFSFSNFSPPLHSDYLWRRQTTSFRGSLFFLFTWCPISYQFYHSGLLTSWCACKLLYYIFFNNSHNNISRTVVDTHSKCIFGSTYIHPDRINTNNNYINCNLQDSVIVFQALLPLIWKRITAAAALLLVPRYACAVKRSL